MDWNQEFKGISIRYQKQLVQIKTDECLMKFLAGKGNGSLELAEHILKTYRMKLGKNLNISKESLSIEILIHAYLDFYSRGIKKMSVMISPKVLEKLIVCMEKLEGHTEIIDSGAKKVDSNRVVFDSLVPFADVIYLMLGTLA